MGLINYEGRKWCLMDLVTDHINGKLRETQVFSIAFKIGALWAYCRYVTAANYETMTLVAGGIFLAHEGFSRIMNQRVQVQQQAAAVENKDAAK